MAPAVFSRLSSSSPGTSFSWASLMAGTLKFAFVLILILTYCKTFFWPDICRHVLCDPSVQLLHRFIIKSEVIPITKPLALRGFFKTRRAVSIFGKHGSISLSIPGYDPPFNIIVYMDIERNPGPVYETHFRNYLFSPSLENVINMESGYMPRNYCYSTQDTMMHRPYSHTPYTTIIHQLKTNAILRLRETINKLKEGELH